MQMWINFCRRRLRSPPRFPGLVRPRAPPTATDFYARNVKGRGSGRKCNDLLVRMEGRVARIRLDLRKAHRADRAGLWVDYDAVKGASARSLRTQLENAPARRIHLRRRHGCNIKDGEIHCTEYAALGAEAIVDVGARAKFTTCRCLTLVTAPSGASPGCASS